MTLGWWTGPLFEISKWWQTGKQTDFRLVDSTLGSSEKIWAQLTKTFNDHLESLHLSLPFYPPLHLSSYILVSGDILISSMEKSVFGKVNSICCHFSRSPCRLPFSLSLSLSAVAPQGPEKFRSCKCLALGQRNWNILEFEKLKCWKCETLKMRGGEMGGLGKKPRQKEVAQNGLRAPLEVIREDELYDIFKRGHNINLYLRELYFVIENPKQNQEFIWPFVCILPEQNLIRAIFWCVWLARSNLIVFQSDSFLVCKHYLCSLFQGFAFLTKWSCLANGSKLQACPPSPGISVPFPPFTCPSFYSLLLLLTKLANPPLFMHPRDFTQPLCLRMFHTWKRKHHLDFDATQKSHIDLVQSLQILADATFWCKVLRNVKRVFSKIKWVWPGPMKPRLALISKIC